MHEERLGENRLNARQQAIGKVLPLAGDGKEAAWLVHHQDLVIVVEDIERIIGRVVFAALHGGLIRTANGMKQCKGQKSHNRAAGIWNRGDFLDAAPALGYLSL